MMFIFGALFRYDKSRFIYPISAIFIVLGFVCLNIIGERLFLFAPILVLASIRFARPESTRFFFTLAVFGVLGIISLLLYGVATENAYVGSLFEAGSSFDERMNRSSNWQTAIELFFQKPILGSGLGGYFIPGYSNPGDGVYAHNLFLELLTEFGVVGAVLIIGPIIYFLIKNFKYMVRTRTSSGSSLYPYLALAFLHSMVSHDLTTSIFWISAFYSILLNARRDIGNGQYER
jgi:O-antigen ligase